MRIVIATGIYPPDIGGPAEYAKHLEGEWKRLGHTVAVVPFSAFKRLPSGVRHLGYFVRIFSRAIDADLIVTLDTFSVGLPSVVASTILRKKNIVRVGGDFLWERYVERTGNLVPLSRFYNTNYPPERNVSVRAGEQETKVRTPELNLKERVIFRLMKFVLRHATHLAFNSEWQRDFTVSAYGLERGKTSVILNYFGEKLPASAPTGKNFVWAVRPIKLKNGGNLRKAFAEAQEEDAALSFDTALTSHDELMRRIASCYAVILPSISEVSPNLISDALRFGKPFIMTRDSGLYEKIKDIGIFVNPLDAQDIKTKILWLANPVNYEEQKKRVAGFNFTHSWQEIAREFLTL